MKKKKKTLCEKESVTSRKCEVKGRVCDISLGQRGGSSYGKGGRGMRSLRSSKFPNPKTSRVRLQLELSLTCRQTDMHISYPLHTKLTSFSYIRTAEKCTSRANESLRHKHLCPTR